MISEAMINEKRNQSTENQSTTDSAYEWSACVGVSYLALWRPARQGEEAVAATAAAAADTTGFGAGAPEE